MQEKLSEQQNKNSELDLLGKAMDVMSKCLKIDASIMKGNMVQGGPYKNSHPRNV